MGTFRDWIPPDEDAGAQADGVFADFVGEPKPEPKKNPEPVKIVEEQENLLSCPKCEFKTIYKVALSGHLRKHK